MTTASQTAYLELATAARLLDVPPPRVKLLARIGLIETRALPVRARYSRASVEALARAATGRAPAPTGPSAGPAPAA